MQLSSLSALAGTCLLMFVGSLLAGLAPLLLNVSESQLQTISAVGAGLLIGTALGVILPEGAEAFRTAQEEADANKRLSDSLFGSVLIAGFIVMLLLDQLHTTVAKGKSFQTSPPPDIDNDPEDPWKVQVAKTTTRHKHVWTKSGSDSAGRAFVGLLVHSAADGFAVGAATRSDSTSLGLTIAFAMVLHKAPVAFGLATTFMAAKWPWYKSQKALLAFSAASPVVALLTYGLIGAIPALSSGAATALCVLFSGGTFLYAACMHILPEVLGHETSLSAAQVAAVVSGSVLPLLLAMTQPHSH